MYALFNFFSQVKKDAIIILFIHFTIHVTEKMLVEPIAIALYNVHLVIISYKSNYNNMLISICLKAKSSSATLRELGIFAYLSEQKIKRASRKLVLLLLYLRDF